MQLNGHSIGRCATYAFSYEQLFWKCWHRIPSDRDLNNLDPTAQASITSAQLATAFNLALAVEAWTKELRFELGITVYYNSVRQLIASLLRLSLGLPPCGHRLLLPLPFPPKAVSPLPQQQRLPRSSAISCSCRLAKYKRRLRRRTSAMAVGSYQKNNCDTQR